VAAGDWRKRIAGGKTSRNCARARNWLPGLCGLLPLLAYKQEGPLATQQLRIHGRKITNRQRLRQHAALVARAAWLKQSRCRFRGDSGKRRNPRLMRSGVAGPGPHSICQLSVVSCQLTVVSCQLSVVSSQLRSFMRCGTCLRSSLRKCTHFGHLVTLGCAGSIAICEQSHRAYNWDLLPRVTRLS
jgi:hypothetical protein